MNTFTIEFFLSTDDDNQIDCPITWGELQAAGLTGTLRDSDHFYGMDKFGAIVITTEQNVATVLDITGIVGRALQSELTVTDGDRLPQIRAETAECDFEDEGCDEEDECDDDADMEDE